MMRDRKSRALAAALAALLIAGCSDDLPPVNDALPPDSPAGDSTSADGSEDGGVEDGAKGDGAAADIAGDTAPDQGSDQGVDQGVDTAPDGPAPDLPSYICGGSVCQLGYYCQYDSGCSGPASCLPKPAYCIGFPAVVCGCDGKTYTNACYANKAGTAVAKNDHCTPGSCGDNAVCGPNALCNKAASDCLGQGVCQARPVLCAAIINPVCGCDGNTYTNACFARKSGTTVSYGGGCTPGVCSHNGECAPDEYCAKAVGDCLGVGSCTKKPGLCTTQSDPQCGCNGFTYNNGCGASKAGVNLSKNGPC